MPLWSNTDVTLSKPKYLKAGDRNNNNANVYGVDAAQASVANTANQKFHGAHQGWVKIIPQYTDSSGQVRRKSETLVVMSTPITGNANIALSGSANVTNGNIAIASFITASLVAANTYVAFSANVIGVIANTDLIYVANVGPLSVNVFSAQNVAVNTAPLATLATQAVRFAAGTPKGNTSVLGVGTNFSYELKVGDVITVGNVGDAFQGIVRSVVAIQNNTWLLVNAAAANVNTGLSVLVGDENWFPHS